MLVGSKGWHLPEELDMQRVSIDSIADDPQSPDEDQTLDMSTAEDVVGVWIDVQIVPQHCRVQR